jgi:hypothetical protein
MRNLISYPITREEVVEFLKDLELVTSFENTQLIGDVRPSIVDALLDLVAHDAEFWDKMEKRMRI